MSADVFPERPGLGPVGRGPRHVAGGRRRLQVVDEPFAVATLVLAVAFALVLGMSEARMFEAAASGWTLTHLFGLETVTVDAEPILVILSDTPAALRITPECSVVLLLAPFLVLATVLCLSRRFSLTRIVTATLAAAVVLVAVNTVRISLIGWALARWGSDGYGWTHTIVGSIMTIIGVGAALAILWFAVVRPGRTGRGQA